MAKKFNTKQSTVSSALHKNTTFFGKALRYIQPNEDRPYVLPVIHSINSNNNTKYITKKMLELPPFYDQFGNKYENLLVAEEKLKINRVYILRVLNKKRYSCKGYIFSFNNVPELKNIKKGSEIKNTFKLIDQFGTIYNSKEEAIKIIDTDRSAINNVLNKKVSHTKGFALNYLHEGKPDFDYTTYKETVVEPGMSKAKGGGPIKDQLGNIYSCPKEACRKLGFSISGINNVLLGKRKQCHGYIFTYLDNTNLNKE